MITVIAGTNRAQSNSLKVARFIVGAYTGLGVDTTLLDLGALPTAAILPDAYSNKTEELKSGFIDPVLAADGLHVVVPEYNGSFPGVLKLFIDLLPFPESFEGRPVAFVGLAAGANGGLRPVEQLQMVFAYRNAYLFNRRVFIPAVHKVLDAAGCITDADLSGRLVQQAKDFAGFARRLRA